MRHLFALCLLATGLVACVSPTEPRFQIEQPFILIEGKITDQPGLSELRVRRSNFREVLLEFTPESGAAVTGVEAAGTQVQWLPVAGEPGVYRPPADFRAVAGESWSVEIRLEDGSTFVSRSEALPPAVPVTGFRVNFAQESRYDDGRERFIPAFELKVDYEDPAGETNYYEWRYRYWEKVIVCRSCFRGRFNGVDCVPFPSSQRFAPERYDYYCPGDAECFREQRGTGFSVATDEFFSGTEVRDRPVGDIEFIDYGGLLIEVQQYGITPAAYAYGKVISDIINGSGGLNATIPAALDGNVSNLDPAGIDALGYVGVASLTTRRQFLERDLDTGIPLPADRSIRPEPMVGTFVPPRAPCAGDGRSPRVPAGWMN